MLTQASIPTVLRLLSQRMASKGSRWGPTAKNGIQEKMWFASAKKSQSKKWSQLFEEACPLTPRKEFASAHELEWVIAKATTGTTSANAGWPRSLPEKTSWPRPRLEGDHGQAHRFSPRDGLPSRRRKSSMLSVGRPAISSSSDSMRALNKCSKNEI